MSGINSEKISKRLISNVCLLRHGIWEHRKIKISLEVLPNATNISKSLENGSFEGFSHKSCEANVALMYAIWYGLKEYIERLLNEFGADVEFSSEQGICPLHLACSLGETEITRILLDHGADPDRWDKEKRATPLHCAASGGYLACLQMLLDFGASVNIGISQKSALHYAIGGNFIECAKMLLERNANPNPPQLSKETALHTAASLGFARAVKLLVNKGALLLAYIEPIKLTALHLAVINNNVECLEILLKAGSPVDLRNARDHTALHLACMREYRNVKIIEILLKYEADPNAVEEAGRTPLHMSVSGDNEDFECVDFLLKNGANPNIIDYHGYASIHIAAMNEFGKCVMGLIDFGADITIQTSGGLCALSIIDQRTPELIPKLVAKLDASIEVDDPKIGDVDCEIKLDFKILAPRAEQGECKLLLSFIRSRQEKLLTHPLSKAFLYLKWSKMRNLFLLSFFLQMIYVFSYTFYIYKVYARKDETTPPENYVKYVGYVIIVITIAFILKESFQMIHGVRAYFKNLKAYLQWGVITTILISLTCDGILNENWESIPEWRREVAGVAIFLVWLKLTMNIGEFPIFGLYVIMFTKVAFNFVVFLVAYSCLLLSFSFSFSILLHNDDSFKTIPKAFMKTFIMMIGEFDFEDANSDSYSIAMKILYFFFMILITIILANLLVGLAVSDIQELQDSSEYDLLIRQTQLISRVEFFCLSSTLRNIWPRLVDFLRQVVMIRKFKPEMEITIRPNDRRDEKLSSKIKLAIYKLVIERSNQNQSVRLKNRTKNWDFLKNCIKQKHINSDDLIQSVTQTVLNLENIVENNSSGDDLSNKEGISNQIHELEKKIDSITVMLQNILLDK